MSVRQSLVRPVLLLLTLRSARLSQFLSPETHSMDLTESTGLRRRHAPLSSTAQNLKENSVTSSESAAQNTASPSDCPSNSQRFTSKLLGVTWPPKPTARWFVLLCCAFIICNALHMAIFPARCSAALLGVAVSKHLASVSPFIASHVNEMFGANGEENLARCLRSWPSFTGAQSWFSNSYYFFAEFGRSHSGGLFGVYGTYILLAAVACMLLILSLPSWSCSRFSLKLFYSGFVMCLVILLCLPAVIYHYQGTAFEKTVQGITNFGLVFQPPSLFANKIDNEDDSNDAELATECASAYSRLGNDELSDAIDSYLTTDSFWIHTWNLMEKEIEVPGPVLDSIGNRYTTYGRARKGSFWHLDILTEMVANCFFPNFIEDFEPSRIVYSGQEPPPNYFTDLGWEISRSLNESVGKLALVVLLSIEATNAEVDENYKYLAQNRKDLEQYSGKPDQELITKGMSTAIKRVLTPEDEKDPVSSSANRLRRAVGSYLVLSSDFVVGNGSEKEQFPSLPKPPVSFECIRREIKKSTLFFGGECLVKIFIPDDKEDVSKEYSTKSLDERFSCTFSSLMDCRSFQDGDCPSSVSEGPCAVTKEFFPDLDLGLQCWCYDCAENESGKNGRGCKDVALTAAVDAWQAFRGSPHLKAGAKKMQLLSREGLVLAFVLGISCNVLVFFT